MLTFIKRQVAFFLLNLVALRWLLSLLTTAESSLWWTTGTTGDGTTTYTEAQLTTFFGDLFTPNTTIGNPNATQGVLPGVGSELAVTGASSPVAVATGAALTEGYAYRNTASVNVTIPTPSSATRIDRIVLRVSHSTTRTVRITRIAGTEGTGTAPAITQTAGTTWDIKLAQVSITTGGVITVTDERTFAHFATRLDVTAVDGATAGYLPFGDTTGRLKQDTSGGPFWDDTNNRLGLGTSAPSRHVHIAGAGQATPNLTDAGNKAGTVFIEDTGSSADNGGATLFGASGKFWAAIKATVFDLTTNSMGDLVIALRAALADTALTEMFRFKRNGQLIITPPATVAPIALGANGQGQLVTGLNADQIDGLDLAINRQGGSATNWWTGGTTTRTVSQVRIQMGTISLGNIGAGGGGSASVTFPVAFSNVPFVIIVGSPHLVVAGLLRAGTTVATPTTTGFDYEYTNNGGSTQAAYLTWIAIGPQ